MQNKLSHLVCRRIRPHDGLDSRHAPPRRRPPTWTTRTLLNSRTRPHKDRWTIYTEEFIDRYELNDEQQQKAFTFLRRQQERRDAFLKHSAPEMEKVTAQLQNARNGRGPPGPHSKPTKGLSGPVDRLFAQLQERLETLPTRAQRRDAVAAGRVSEEDAPPGVRAARTATTRRPG